MEEIDKKCNNCYYFPCTKVQCKADNLCEDWESVVTREIENIDKKVKD